jgi:hypothetical protein
MSKTNVLPIKLPLKKNGADGIWTHNILYAKQAFYQVELQPKNFNLNLRRLWDSNPYQTDRQPAILTIKLNRKIFFNLFFNLVGSVRIEPTHSGLWAPIATKLTPLF